MSTDAPERPCLFIGPDGQCRAPAAYVGSSRELGQRFLCEAHKDADAVRTPIALFWAEVFAPAEAKGEITDVRIGKRPLQKAQQPLTEQEILGALERSPFPQQVRDFHAHLDECAQCREHPFNPCDAGARLLELGGRG